MRNLLHRIANWFAGERERLRLSLWVGRWECAVVRRRERQGSVVFYVTDEEIRVAAYYLAEKDGFRLPAETYWCRAENVLNAERCVYEQK